MKVLHVAETVKGGVATVMNELVTAQALSYKFDVFCIAPSSQVNELKLTKEVKLTEFSSSKRGIWSFVNLALTFARVINKNKPDIVHCHSTFAGAICRLLLMAVYFFYRPKVIYCPHGFSFLMKTSRIKKKIYILIERFLLTTTDVVICVGRFEYDEAIKAGLDKEKLTVINNGVPAQSLSSPEKKARLELLFVGRLDYQKGFDILLEAVKSLSREDVHLTVVGDSVLGAADYRTYDERITYLGWITKDKVAACYVNANILIMPSRWEGFAMAPLEAMSYGVPVLASNYPALVEVVIDGYNGLIFESGNSSSLREKIELLHVDGLRKMGENARNFLLSNFTSEAMIEKTVATYYS